MHREGVGAPLTPPPPLLPARYLSTLIQQEAGGVWSLRPVGGASRSVCLSVCPPTPPGEHRGGLIGADLWVWEEKAEAGLGKGGG